jgi:Cu/Ag efflux protein CusF
MRIGASGWLAGMSALLLATMKAPVDAAQTPQGEAGASETPAESAPGSLSGAVKSASPEGVWVSVRGAPDVQLRMKPRTVVMVEGRMATVSDLREGDAVRALYRDVQGEPMAILVEVTARARPEPGESK